MQKIDQTCRYKFDWGWLDEALPDNGGNSPPVRLGDFIRKVDAAGKVLCQWCGDTINYANRGCAAVCRSTGKGMPENEFFKVQNVNFLQLQGVAPPPPPLL